MSRATECSRHLLFHFVFQLFETRVQRGGGSTADLLRYHHVPEGSCQGEVATETYQPCLKLQQVCILFHLLT